MKAQLFVFALIVVLRMDTDAKPRKTISVRRRLPKVCAPYQCSRVTPEQQKRLDDALREAEDRATRRN